MKTIESLTVTKDTVICRDKDKSFDLYRVISGTLLICKRNNHMVTPIAHLKPGQYFGEMSFFDNISRSADVIALEETVLEKIPQTLINSELPNWLHTIAQNMTKRLRFLSQTISDKGIKRTTKELKPLSIEEQRHIYSLLASKE